MENQEKSTLQYVLLISLGVILLLLSEYIIVLLGWVHMFAILPILFINSTIIGLILKIRKWQWYQNGIDNGVLLGISIILGYGILSLPFNFQRTGDSAIIYILFSLTTVIAGLFLYPIVLRMFIKRNRKIKSKA